MHVERIALHAAVPAVERFLELRARQHLAGRGEQLLQQHELAALQGHRPALVRHAERGRVEPQVAVLEHVVRRAAHPALQDAHPREQLLDVEGLDQVVVRAGVQAGDALRDRIARAQDQHRGHAAGGARPAQHLEAVQAGQAEVQHHGVEAAVLERRQRVGTAAHPVDRIARARQRVLDAGAEELVVLYEKQAHAGRIAAFQRIAASSDSISLRRPSSASARSGRGGARRAFCSARRAPTVSPLR